MTTAIPAPAPGAGDPKGSARAATRRGGGGASFHRLWQVPLLIAGIAAFGYGVKLLAGSIKPVPFETHVGDIRRLIDTQKHAAAIAQINKIANHFEKPAQLGALHLLAGDAYYAATREQLAAGGAAKENFEQVITHYRTAEKYGSAWTAAIRERVGESALAIDDHKLAVEQIDQVIETNPAALQRHARGLVHAQLETGAAAKAHETLEKLLKLPELPVDDRVWALCRRIELTLGTPDLDGAVAKALAALPQVPERNPAGTLLTWIGRAEFEAGRADAARTHLADARSRFVVHNLDDGRAAVLLAKIAQARGEPATALKLYQEVITAHPGSAIHPAARLGRAEVFAGKREITDLMEEDYLAAIKAVRDAEPLDRKAPRPRGEKPEMITRATVRASLLSHYQEFQKENRLEDALRFLALARELGEPETAANVYREATTRERRGDELLAQSRVTRDRQEAATRHAASSKFYGEAADAYLRHADLVALEDELYGASIWKAAQLMDRAGRLPEAVKLYEKFARERPRDSRVPEALYAIGLLHQSLVQFDEAIAAHERNRRENPKTPAAYLSTVQLARCYMAKGEKSLDQAEAVLLSLVEDNPNITPTANEFRVSLFTLGELYYKSQKWSRAILRLEEAIERYPSDLLVPRATFWLADCYRKSAGEIDEAVRKDPGIAHRDSLEKARQDRLHKSAELYEAVISMLDRGNGSPLPAAGTLEEEYLRYSHVNRAECFFELGQYPAAIKLYDGVATRYAQSLTALEAYVQIVRGYMLLKEPSQAQAAAERARWILKRIPDEAFDRPPLRLSREYYEKFLQLAGGGGGVR